MAALKNKKSLVSILALSFCFMLFFAFKTDAAVYPYFGVQPDDDEYLYFGNDDYPSTTKQGITFSVLESSVSHQSVIAFATLEYVPNSTLIDQREITDFFILANGRIVDWFNPAFDNETGKWRTTYRLRITLDNWNTGSIVNLQVVAVTNVEVSKGVYNSYVVAWSDVQGPYQLKSYPVIDRESVTLLESILARLGSMSSMLSAKLDTLTKKVEEIYTPTPATEQAFDNAVNSLKDKLPMNEMIDKVDKTNEVLKESKKKLKNPGEKIKIGGEFCFIPGVAESCYPVMDLTEWREQLLLFRKICEAALWVYFFYMLMEKLTPKPRL